MVRPSVAVITSDIGYDLKTSYVMVRLYEIMIPQRIGLAFKNILCYGLAPPGIMINSPFQI